MKDFITFPNKGLDYIFHKPPYGRLSMQSYAEKLKKEKAAFSKARKKRKSKK